MSKMSKTRPNKSRAEILAKRHQPIVGFDGLPAPVNHPVSRSKYTPHMGEKELERGKRTWSSMYLNEQVAQFHPRHGHLRVSPTLCQISGSTHEAYLDARQQEYEYDGAF